MGGRVHIPLHPDQRLHLNLPGDCRVLQPQRWQGTHLRRHEQRLRMGQAAKVLHGREHRVPAADGTHTQLLQVPYGQAGHKSLRTEENKPHQSIRVQVHQRTRKVDKNGKALSAEHLHGQQIIPEPFCSR